MGLGVRVGKEPLEYEVLGIDFKARGSKCEEQIPLLRRLWTEKVVSFKGRWDHF
jgi:alkanesulfonate monooxygenase SsuD/methylene tetrahydromethanopterin reductase-like flavin-dependent oxidoreductase (luciferase family)